MKKTYITPFLGLIPSIIALKYDKKKSIIYFIGTITSIFNHLTKDNNEISNLHKYLKYLDRFTMCIFFIFLFNDVYLFKIFIVSLYIYSKIVNCDVKKDNLHAFVHVLATILLLVDLRLNYLQKIKEINYRYSLSEENSIINNDLGIIYFNKYL